MDFELLNSMISKNGLELGLVHWMTNNGSLSWERKKAEDGNKEFIKKKKTLVSKYKNLCDYADLVIGSGEHKEAFCIYDCKIHTSQDEYTRQLRVAVQYVLKIMIETLVRNGKMKETVKLTMSKFASNARMLKDLLIPATVVTADI